MAEVADLHHHLPPQEEEIETLRSVPYWYSFCDHDNDDDDIYSSYEPDPDEFDPFSPLNFDSFDHSLHSQIIFDERETCVELVGSDDEEGSDSEVNTVFNIFQRCNNNQEEDETHVIGSDDDIRFRIFDENEEMGANYVELGLGVNREIGDLSEDDEDGISGFMMEEFGGDNNYHVSRRDTGESSDVRNVELFRDGGLRVVGMGSDSDEEEDGIFGIGFHDVEEEEDGFDCGPEDLGLQLCWDSLRLEEDQRESNEEFEWEEVDERGGDEREVMNMVIDAEVGRRLVSTEMLSGEVGEGGETMTRTLEWEVLLAVNNLDRELVHDGDHDGYYPAEYETLFGQVAEHDSFVRGNPPAARTVIRNLPSVVLTQEDVETKSATCAVCKDEMGMEEQVKKLPCSHCYHGDCILPWLGIRNTCPVCRYELPTDDPDYERMRTRRAVDRGVSRDDHDQVRYDFEIFSEQ
ncbi:hypothetical protein MKW94_015469 [Papaver nudicaule]|uniref:RING-type E3 ubiquitin transferase n=1 Tax=Papaver nudicaule TaxID=74823 RepID=A0AA42AWV3_PAPNU|nr:hypothetical protein [Papaver nudicaule]